MRLQRPQPRRGPTRCEHDLPDLRRSPLHALTLQSERQLQQLARRARRHHPRPGNQRLEAAPAVRADPLIKRAARNSDQPAIGPNMLTASERANQPATLSLRDRRIGGIPDQRVPEQPDLPTTLLIHSFSQRSPARARTLSAHRTRGKGELVLHNNRPPDNTEATRHTPVAAKRSTHALPASAIASSASATPPPAGKTAPNSRSSATSQRVKCALIASRSATNRRNQPRTVSFGTPNRPAIDRCPSPATPASIAAPITATSSRRRNNTRSGNSTCVPPHPPQRARRGRKTRSPATQRNTRARACPHGLNLPRHDGHPRTPPANSASTPAPSTHTINIGCHLRHPREPSRRHQADGRALAFTNAQTLPADRPSRPSTARTPPCVPNSSSAQQRPRDGLRWRRPRPRSGSARS